MGMLLPYIIHTRNDENGSYGNSPKIIFLGIYATNRSAFYGITSKLFERMEILDLIINMLKDDGLDEHEDIIKHIPNFRERYAECNTDEEFWREFKEELLNIPKIPKLCHNSFYKAGWDYGVYDILNRRHIES
jgi:hypothetical protein